MYSRTCLGLEEAQRGIAAAMEEAQRDGRPMAFAVVDDRGHLIASARMDGAHERVLRFAIRKAYTAAIMGRPTLDLKREMEERHRTLADYGDPMFTTLQGGLPVVHEGKVVGGISVGGNAQNRDEEIAAIALKAIGLG